MATGRIKRSQLAERLDAVQRPPAADPVCPLCDRPIPPSQQDAHHLVPKSRGGRSTALLHRICHRQVHALFSETELARDYASAEALRAHPDVAKFIEWVKTKPPAFMERTRRSGRRK
jgi:5-methylcytosine-specific restriction endonuclease McrA